MCIPPFSKTTARSASPREFGTGLPREPSRGGGVTLSEDVRMGTLLAAFLFLRAAAMSPSPTACGQHAQNIRAAIQRVQEKQKNVGLAVAVAHDSKVIF